MSSGTMDSSEGAQLEDRTPYLPLANISRIMKNALPANAKITKDAKECMQECLTEFIGFITSEGGYFPGEEALMGSVGEVS
jgi:nuclear transcription Y subunit beta